MAKRELKYAPAYRPLVPAKASYYIAHISSAKPGTKVILCCRVSTLGQCFNGDLNDQEANLRRVAAKYGLIVVGVVRHVGPGWDPWWLQQAVELAKKHGAILLAETTCRYIRTREFHPALAPDAQAEESDFNELLKYTQDVPLMTDLPPDASPAEIHSYQIDRGRTEKGRNGGRPRKTEPDDKQELREKEPGYMKERLKNELPRVLELHRNGASRHEIERQTGIPLTTVRRWIRKYAADAT